MPTVPSGTNSTVITPGIIVGLIFLPVFVHYVVILIKETLVGWIKLFLTINIGVYFIAMFLSTLRERFNSGFNPLCEKIYNFPFDILNTPITYILTVSPIIMVVSYIALLNKKDHQLSKGSSMK